MLAGRDTPEDYESDSEDDESVDEGVISDDKEIDVTVFMDAYKYACPPRWDVTKTSPLLPVVPQGVLTTINPRVYDYEISVVATRRFAVCNFYQEHLAAVYLVTANIKSCQNIHIII